MNALKWSLVFVAALGTLALAADPIKFTMPVPPVETASIYPDGGCSVADAKGVPVHEESKLCEALSKSAGFRK